MPTESSAVSDIIRQVQSRRLGTDPADCVLFEGTKPARPTARGTSSPAAIPAWQPERGRRPSPAATVARPAYPLHPSSRRDHVWPFLLATVLMGALGVFGARYVTTVIEGDRVAHVSSDRGTSNSLAVAPPSVASIPQPRIAPVVEPVVTPVEAAEPDVEPPAPVVEPASIAATPVPAPARRVGVKSKRFTAKRTIETGRGSRASKPVTKATALPAVNAQTPEIPPPERIAAPPPPGKKARQELDSENPL